MSTSRKATKSIKYDGGVALLRRPPMHPGRLIEEIRAGQTPPVSQRQTAFRLGISVKHQHDIEREAKPVSVAIAIKYQALTGVDAETWLKLQMRFDLWHALQETKNVRHVIPGAPFATKAAGASE